jgi:hypothetical protein
MYNDNQSDQNVHWQMESFSIPPFWATTRDSDLTAALINAQRSERRAESRLIKRRLKRIKVELDLYSHMEKRTAHRLRKTDTGVGIPVVRNGCLVLWGRRLIIVLFKAV